MRPSLRTTLAAAATVAVALAAAVPVATADAAPGSTTVRVDADGQAGWLFNRDVSTSSPYEFSLLAASAGSGSLYVLPITNTTDAGLDEAKDKFVAEQFLRAPVSSVTSIAYDFRIAGPTGEAGDADEFYLNVYANIDDSDNFYDCRFDYVPSTGSTSEFSTAMFETTATPSSVTQRGERTACPATLAGMPEGSHIRVFSLNVGGTSSSDTGLAGFLDNVVVTTTEGATAYDFEVPEPVKQECKDGGYVALGFANQGQCISALQADPRAGR